MIEIIPAILTNDPKELEEKIMPLEGKVRRVQIDIVDGNLVDNRTVSPDVLGNLETSLLIDFQLVTKEPVDWLERCVKGQGDRIIGHVEGMTSQQEFMGRVVELGAKVGLALDLATPVSAIEENILANLDVVVLMSVPMGFGGQEFSTGVLAKVSELDKIRVQDHASFRICVDGGVKEDNIRSIVEAGADEVAVGRSLWEGDLIDNIKRLQEAAHL